MALLDARTRPLSGPGHLPGSEGYRRVLVALFAAGMATFVLLYDVQALLPEFVDAFGVSPTQSTLVMSLPTAALPCRCSSSARCRRSSAGPG